MSGMRAPMTDAPADRMGRGGAEVRRPLRLRHLGGEPFELTAADVLEVLAARGFVAKPLRRERPARANRSATVAADVLRQRDAVGHRRALDRDERHDVHGAEARMLALVCSQIDGGDGGCEEREGRRLERRRIPDEREDRTVVRGVGRMVEQPHARAAERRRPGARRHRGAGLR